MERKTAIGIMGAIFLMNMPLAAQAFVAPERPDSPVLTRVTFSEDLKARQEAREKEKQEKLAAKEAKKKEAAESKKKASAEKESEKEAKKDTKKMNAESAFDMLDTNKDGSLSKSEFTQGIAKYKAYLR